jgi:hypothetical protein
MAALRPTYPPRLSGIPEDDSGNAIFEQVSTSGIGFMFKRDLGSASTNSEILKIHQDNAGDDQACAYFLQDGNGVVLKFATAATSANGAEFNCNTITTGTGFKIYSNSLTTGYLIDAQNNNASMTQSVIRAYNSGSGPGLEIGGTSDAPALRLPNLSSTPTVAAVIGDLCVVSGILYICTTAGTPGTWTKVGTQT